MGFRENMYLVESAPTVSLISVDSLKKAPLEGESVRWSTAVFEADAVGVHARCSLGHREHTEPIYQV